MSTYLYLECHDHTPHLQSQDEVGQHLYDLPRIRQEVADRKAIVEATELGANGWDNYFTRHAVQFLVQHPHCDLHIMDEYGREHPLEDAEKEDGK